MKTSDYIGNRPATNCRKKWLIRKLSLDNGRSTRRQMSQSTLGVTYEDDEASNMPSENESITDQTADDVAFRRLQRKTYHAAAAAAVATCRTSDVQVTWSRRQVEMLRKRCHGKVHSYMLGRCDELVEHSDTSNARESPDAVPVDCLSPASSMPTALNVDSEIGSNADGHGCAQEVSPSDFPSGSQSRSESCRSVTSCKDAIRGSTIGDIRSRRRRRNRWQAGNWQKRAKLMKKLGRRSPKSSSPVLVQDDDSRTLDCFPSDALMAIAAETDRETGSAVEESLVTVTTCFLADHFPDANGVEQESEGTRPSLEMCTTGSLATVETIIEDHKDEPDNSNVTSLLIAPEVVDVVQTSEVSAECCHSSVTEAAEESKCLVEELTDCVSGSLTDAVSSRENVDTVDCVSESFHVESRVPAAGVVPDSPLALSTCSKSSERSDERLHVGTLSRTSSSVSVRDECASDVSVPLPADADNTDVVIVTRRRDLLGSVSVANTGIRY
jgi:hypothetical protein